MSLHEIRGRLYEGGTSRNRAAVLRVYADGTVRLALDGNERALSIGDLDVPARLGDTPRRIGLPDGGEFETEDNAAVDAMQDAHGPPRHDWLHRMENRLGAVVVATLCVLAAGALFVWRGVPLIAREAAFAVSPEVSAQLGRGTLEILDRTFEVSELPDERREALRARFEAMVAGTPEADAYDFALVFRGGGSFGANAFALPEGTVVMTDELVALADHDEELFAVLAHEIGHVVHRHGLRSAIQSSMLLLAVVALTGDLSSTSGVVAALPTLLAEASFSRDFEREADDHALAWMVANDVDPSRFAALLRRLERGSFPIPFIASHPTTEERIARLEEAAGEAEGR